MGIPIPPDYPIGVNCPAGVGFPHNYWPVNTTPLYVYVTFTGLALCFPIVSWPVGNPNNVTIRLTQAGPCNWIWNNGSWFASWSLGFFNVVTLDYFDGLQNRPTFQGHNPAGKTISTNITACGVPFTLASGGLAELVWSVAPRKILYDYNLAAVAGTRIAVVPKDANTSQYRFANKAIGMNIWVEYDHS